MNENMNNQIQNETNIVANKNSNSFKRRMVLVLALIFVISLSIGGTLAVTHFVKIDDVSTTDLDTTTTTEATTQNTTTAKKEETNNKLLHFASLEDYANQAKSLNKQSSRLVSDGGFTKMDFEIEERCKNNKNERVQFNKDGHSISYVCYYVDPGQDPHYETTIYVDNKYSMTVSTGMNCGNSDYYFNKNFDDYYIHESGVCSTGAPHILEIIAKGNFNNKISIDYQMYNQKKDFSGYEVPIIVKDNIVYFVEADDKSANGDNPVNTTCRIKYIDLNKKNYNIIDTGVSESCIYYSGE